MYQAMATVLLLIAVIGIGITLFQARRLARANNKIVSELSRLAEGQRLSVVFTISPSSLVVDPADFEPKRGVVRERLLRALETETKRNLDPDTLAFCVLEHSGWGTFVDRGETFMPAKTALGRLLTNNDMAGAKRFLTVLANQL